VARSIRDTFEYFQTQFREITCRAKQRFALQDWHGMQKDHRERLDVYASTVEQLLARIGPMLAERLHSRLMWASIKAVYSGLIDDRDDWEIAETYFNSITRQIFSTVGVDNEIEFVHTDFTSPPTPSRHAVHHTCEGPWLGKSSLGQSSLGRSSLAQGIGNLLRLYPQLGLSDMTIQNDSQAVATAIIQCLPSVPQRAIDRLDMITSVFYRGNHAYLLGRMVLGSTTMPLALCFCHVRNEARIDAVLLKKDDVSMLFGYTRSYFHVEVERPHDMVAFINSILPRKKTAEVYISLGFNKHGKTELYRNALRHLARTEDQYQLAEGKRGMVMVVFTMPSYPVVFKIIKDRFDYPKECSRQDVIDRYHLVFNHDRAGRLIDAQQYKYLVLDRHRFDPALLDELLEVAGRTVSVDENRVVIKHCYAERRVHPLDIYLRQVDEQTARAAVIDYGNAIKDLVTTGLFPGDLLLKNFGVTRKQRVVFYDYDEICLLTQCKFRKFPKSEHEEDVLAAEPWYGVGPMDIFPQEFIHFLGLPPHLKKVFLEHHGNLFEVEYWRDLQHELESGNLLHVAPYPDQKRLPARRRAQQNQTCTEVA
jgi:isocitrate dehydrogenase kinase/phosphatase